MGVLSSPRQGGYAVSELGRVSDPTIFVLYGAVLSGIVLAALALRLPGAAPSPRSLAPTSA